MHTNLSEEQPLRPGSTVRRIVNGQVVQLQVVQDQGGKIFVTDPANPKRVDQMDRKDIAPMTPEEEEEAAKDQENPDGPPKLKPHGIVPDPSAAVESKLVSIIEGLPFESEPPAEIQTDWYQAFMAVRGHLLVLSKAVIDGNTSAATQFALQSSGLVKQYV